MIDLDDHGTWATIPEAAKERGITTRAMERLIARNPHTIRAIYVEDERRTYVRTDDIHKPRPHKHR